MILTDSSSAYAGSNQVRTIASFNSNLYNFMTYSDTVLSRVVSGTGIGILKNGPSVLTLSAANTYTGNTTVSSGMLSIIDVNALPGYNTNGRFAVAPNATLAVYNAVTDAEVTTLRNTTNFKANSNIGFDTTSGNRTYTPTLNNTSQGALGVTKLGQNTLIIPTAGTYTGTTSVLVGTLSTFGANIIPDSSPVFIDSGATLVLGGSDTLATISGRGTLNCQSNNITLNSNNNSTFSGILTSIASGNWSIFKQGTNTITLSGATVRVSGTDSVLRMETGGMNLVGNTSFIQNRTSSSPRNFQMALNGGTTFNLTISGGASLTTAGVMFGENNGGSATVNLLSGGTWNSGGGGGQSWMSGLSSIFNIDGGAYSAALFYIGGGPAGTTSIINLNSGSLSLTNTLQWQGGGRCVFNLNGGTATFSNFGQAALTDNTFNFNGGTFTIQNNNNYNYNASNVKYIVKSGGAVFDVPSGRTITFNTLALSADNVSTGGGLMKIGAGTLQLGNVLNTFTGQFSALEGIVSVTTLNNNSTNGPFGRGTSPIILGSAGKTATILFNPSAQVTSTKQFNLPTGGIGIFDVGSNGMDLVGNITGNGSLIKNGTGFVQLRGVASSYSGGTILNSGLVIPRTNNAFGTGNVTFNGSSIRTGGGALPIISNTISLCADTTFPNVAGETSLTFTGPVTIFGSTKTLNVGIGINVPNTVLNFSGSIGDNGNGYGITKTGSGTLVLSGNNTYSGNTTINAGFLVIGHVNGFGTIGEIRFTSNTAGTLTYGVGVTNDLSSRIRNNTFRIKHWDLTGQTIVYASLDSTNTGGLTKLGTGTLVLTGSNNTFMNNSASIISTAGTLSFAGTHSSRQQILVSSSNPNERTGVITVSGSLIQNVNTSGTRTFTVAENINALGTLNVVSGATLQLSGGLMLGGNSTGSGVLNMFGGLLKTGPSSALGGQLWVAGNSVINMYDGTIDVVGSPIYHGGGAATPNPSTTINLSGGSIINVGRFDFGIGQVSGINTFTNLNGGSISVSDLANNSRNGNTHTMVFNGGKLNIRATSTIFSTLSSIVRSGGAILDIDSGQTVTAPNLFLDGGEGGGLTKIGEGTLALSAINTYTGTTNVSAGTLRVLRKISGTGSDASFTQADFTPTTLTVTFVAGTPPSIGNTYKLFPASTQQTYSLVSTLNYSGSATYNSTDSTLSIVS